MPDKQLTIATYAAGASLAAITLVYVFAPTFFIDGDAGGVGGNRKRGVVGLMNTANDCFINSVLQALAGLGDLRIYLIRETHRRRLDGKDVYMNLVDDPRTKQPAWKVEGLQGGIVTKGLKDMLDALNERPLCKKTVSASPFVRALEDAFRQRISRQQQDAQEFLQVVAERLCDEYHAGHRARRARLSSDLKSKPEQALDGKNLDQRLSQLDIEDGQEKSNIENPLLMKTPVIIEGVHENLPRQSQAAYGYDDEEGFPLEGRFESQIECLTCGFKPKPSSSTFCTMTLNVPQVSSTTLNTCFDGMFKTEYIDDFKCEKCRLVHAVEMFQQELAKSNTEKFVEKTRRAIDSIQEAIDTDPEKPPSDIGLPDLKFAPKRRIARHIRITKFPKIMAIHLSRSIFDIGRSSMKNSAKVAFPERLPLGGLLDQKKYKLLGLVTHKGSHHSGHYESFRRQNIYPPFSTPNTFEKSGVYSKSVTPTISTATTPKISALQTSDDAIPTPSTSELLSAPASSRVSLASSLSTSKSDSRSSTDTLQTIHNGRHPYQSPPGPTVTLGDKATKPSDSETSSLRSAARSARSTLSRGAANISHSLSRTGTPKSLSPQSSSDNSPTNTALASNSSNTDSPNMSKTRGTSFASSSSRPASALATGPKRKKVSDRWWRISDDKIKESKTSEVLAMQREVYLLFYEMEKGDGF